MAQLKLEDRHLADLHALAEEAGLDRFRMLTKPELAKALRDTGLEEAAEELEAEQAAEPAEPEGAEELEAAEEEGAEPAEREEEREEREEGEERKERERPREARREEERDEGEPTEGILDITPRRHGFLRGPGMVRGEDDVYVSPAQIRRCELRPGDRVAGPARPPRERERHPALIHVDNVDGAEPESKRPDFGSLESADPVRRLEFDLGTVKGDRATLLRAVDLLAPHAFGQKRLALTEPGAGSTTYLDSLAFALEGSEQLELIVLLVTERDEDVEGWRERHREVPIAACPGDRPPVEQLRTARVVLERCKRLVERGRDVVLLVDSLTRVGIAEGGFSLVTELFDSARDTADQSAGSLTVIGTADPLDEGASDELRGKETALVTFDLGLAEEGVWPALDPSGCRAEQEEQILGGEAAAALRGLREQLAELEPAESANRLAELIRTYDDNTALLGEID